MSDSYNTNVEYLAKKVVKYDSAPNTFLFLYSRIGFYFKSVYFEFYVSKSPVLIPETEICEFIIEPNYLDTIIHLFRHNLQKSALNLDIFWTGEETW